MGCFCKLCRSRVHKIAQSIGRFFDMNSLLRSNLMVKSKKSRYREVARRVVPVKDPFYIHPRVAASVLVLRPATLHHAACHAVLSS